MTRIALALPLLCSGCIIAYAPAVQPLGRVMPDTTRGSHDLALEGDLGRNLTEGAGISHEGELEAADGTPQWPCWGLAYRQGLGRGVGIEGRLSGSLMLPLPAPVPNGLSLAPVFRIARWGDTLQLHTIPRFAYVKGFVAVAAGDQFSSETWGLGAEVPAILSWEPVEVFAATGTFWMRGYHLSQRADHKPEGEDTIVGHRGGWLSFGSGAAVNLFLQPGIFRFGLGAGVEWMPNPGARVGYADSDVEPPGSFWIPEAGLSMGFAWGGEQG